MSEKNHEHNVDTQEVAKFDALAKQWWDINGPMKPLHQLNPVRLEFIEKHFDLSNKIVADVGCGGGILTESIAQKARVTIGIDMSEQALQAAQRHATEQALKIDYQKIAIEDYAKAHPASVDGLTCMELLEHVPDPAQLIQSCHDMVKPGGLIFFSTINRHVKAYLKAIIAAEYVLNMLPKGTHQYDKFIKPSELNRAAVAAGLELRDLNGIDYSVMSDSYFLSNNVDVNYVACYQRPE